MSRLISNIWYENTNNALLKYFKYYMETEDAFSVDASLVYKDGSYVNKRIYKHTIDRMSKNSFNVVVNYKILDVLYGKK